MDHDKIDSSSTKQSQPQNGKHNMHVITILRYYLGLSQVALANQSGASFADLNEIENGKVYGMITKFRKLAEYLHIPVHTIVTNDLLGVPDAFFQAMHPAAYLPPAKSKTAMLGRVGEDKAFEIEKQRLAAVNATLSKLVIPCYKLHATHGYDIISYHDDGTPVFIEVKTTNKTNPGEFQMTKYETETATKLTEAGYEYWIYVFSNGIDGNMQLEKVPFKRLLDERRIEPVRYQCNIRPHPETENGILYFRRKMGISQIEAANIMDIPAPSLCAYENGDKQCPVTAYEKMAKFYGVTIDDLLKDYPAQHCD